MTFLEIIRHPITNLPIEQDENVTFREMVKRKLDTFGELIESSRDLSEAVNDINFQREIFKRRSKIIREGIVKTIDAYYEGNVNKAYNILSSFMKESNLTNYLNKEYGHSQRIIRRSPYLQRL